MQENINNRPTPLGFHILTACEGRLNMTDYSIVRPSVIRARNLWRPQTPPKEEIMLSTKVRGKSVSKMKSMQLLTIILVAAVAVFFAIGEPAMAKGWKIKTEELDPVNVFIEWNTTDEDQGIQFFWDSDGFTRMMVFNDSGKKVLDINTKNSVKEQGLTEVAIESVEPDVSEQTLEEFFKRFPAGTYKFWGRSIDKGWLFGEAEFTHDLADPVTIDLSGWPIIGWTPGGGGAEVVGYEIVVELVVNIDDEEIVYKQTTTLPPEIEELTVSGEFANFIEDALDEEIVEELKVEILADEESGNRTITEVPICFDQPDNVCPEED
jgi:hypothetical protein